MSFCSLATPLIQCVPVPSIVSPCIGLLLTDMMPEGPQVFPFTVAVWTALTACALLLAARIWLWRILPNAQKVETARSVALGHTLPRAVPHGEQTGHTLTLFGDTQGTIAFFHPFADGGGGGERVLWCAMPQPAQLKLPTSPARVPQCSSSSMRMLLVAVQGSSCGGPAGVPAAQRRPVHWRRPDGVPAC